MNSIQQTILTTERLILKSITPAMIHELYRIRTQEEIMAFFGFDEAGYARFRDMHEQGMESYNVSLYLFLLTEKHTGRPIGECGFHTWNKTHARAEVFYGMRTDEWKQRGYMTGALPHVLTFGFDQLRLHRIQALVASDNVPYLRLLQRFGFTREGTLREDYNYRGQQEHSECYSLLKHEWKNSR